MIEPLDPRRVRQMASRAGIPASDADDVAQDALEWVCREEVVIEPEKGLSASIVRAVRSMARKYHRRVQREVLTPSGEIDVRDERADPEAEADEASRVSFLHLLIAKLDDRHRGILVNHELRGIPLNEIAESEGITERAAQTRLQRAREELEQARARWQAEQRRRGRSTSPALLAPVACLCRATRSRAWFLRRIGFRSVVHAIVGGAIVADAVLLVTCSPFRPTDGASDPALGKLAAPASVPVTAPPATVPPAPAPASAAPEPTRTAVDAAPGALAATAGAPATAPPASSVSRSAAPAPTPAATSATAAVHLLLEESLIALAEVSIAAGGPANRVEALAFLDQHMRDFPNGRLTARREALLRQLLAPYPSPPRK